MRAAVVGLGVIGRVHCEVLGELGVELAAVCDIDPRALEAYDCPHYDDLSLMLEKERIDVLHVCTPHHLHADMVVEALGRGINVLCEKPLCIKRADIARILRAESASDAMLGVCLQNRYNPSSGFAKKYLEGRQIKYASGSLLWHRDAAYYASGEWRGKRLTEGGGVLINQAIHTLDLLMWLCGDPKTVTGRTCALALGDVIEVEDTAFAAFDGDVPFGLFATNTAAVDMPTEIRIAAEGEEIVIYPDKVTINGKAEDISSFGKVRGKRVYGSGHERLIADLYSCISSGTHFPVDGAEGARSVRAVLAVYESEGREVPL